MEILGKFGRIEDIPLPWPLNVEIYHRPWDKRPTIEKPDRGIEKLVRVINGFNMQTTGSCEGHLYRNPFPWVQIAGLQYPDLWIQKKVIEFTKEYETDKQRDKPEWFVDQWRHDEAWLRTKEIARSEADLMRLRNGADDFAKYLFEKYLKSED